MPNKVIITDAQGNKHEIGGSGAPGVGVPTGGTTGQVLAKSSDDNYATEWVDVASAPENLDLELLYSYDGTGGKKLTNFDCGDANLILVYFTPYSSMTLPTIGCSILAARSDEQQHCSLAVDNNIFTIFKFDMDGIFNQISQMRVTTYGSTNYTQDATRMVVRRIYAIKGFKSAVGATASTATDVTYDNTASGLQADNAQDAIDEIARAHNNIYRGKYLGDHVTDAQYAAIAAGTFEGLYIGDYWIINDIVWRIAAFDYFINCGDTACTTHHMIVVPDTALYNHVMNDTNITTGGYYGSKMHTSGLDAAKTTAAAAFGAAHILSHREYLTNAVTNGRPSGGSWYDCTVELMNEEMVYGSGIFKPVSDGTTVPPNYTVNKTILPLFLFRPGLIGIRVTFWLRDVITAADFADFGNSGAAAHDHASTSLGVRPYFCIY